MKCTFVVGQHVVCIKAGWRMMVVFGEPSALTKTPEVGKTYKILAMEAFPDGDVALVLEGFPADHGYTYRGFRALQPRPSNTDISIFRKILTGSPIEGEREDA